MHSSHPTFCPASHLSTSNQTCRSGALPLWRFPKTSRKTSVHTTSSSPQTHCDAVATEWKTSSSETTALPPTRDLIHGLGTHPTSHPTKDRNTLIDFRSAREHCFAGTGLPVSTGTAPHPQPFPGIRRASGHSVASGHQASAHVFQSRKGRDHKEDPRKPLTLDRTIDAVADHPRRENSRRSADHVRHVAPPLNRKRDRGIRRSVPPGRHRPGAAAV